MVTRNGKGVTCKTFAWALLPVLGLALVLGEAMWQSGQASEPLEQIRLCFNVPVTLDDGGRLVLNFETGQIIESDPVAWQEIDGRPTPIDVAFRITGEREIGFHVDDFDPRYPLVIDPVMIWNTFMGGGGTDGAVSIAVDDHGNIYVAGYSTSTWGTPINPYAAGYDAFVARLDPDGTRRWHTFLGGTGNDHGYGIVLLED